MPDVTMFEVKEDFQQLQWCAENKGFGAGLNPSLVRPIEVVIGRRCTSMLKTFWDDK